MPSSALSLKILLSSLKFVTDLYKALAPQFRNLIQTKSDRFLNYDPGFLLDSYAAEQSVANGITYTRICDLLKLAPAAESWDDQIVDITVIAEPFARSNGSAQWQKASSAGYTALLESGRIGANESTVRVSDASGAGGRAKLTLQRGTYHDQAHSNLVLDFDRDNPNRYVPLRAQLHNKYPERLPALSDRRLANGLGVASLLFYRSNGQWTPYIVRRVKKLGVFPGGLHCTASGVAKWPVDPGVKTLANFATDHMLSEIEEEVGLTPADLVDFRPIALCREMARGGKPQLFYAGFTLLDRDVLADRRKEATRVIEATNQWPEIERDRWFRSADVVNTPSKLRARIGRWGLTLEGAAAFHFGREYARVQLPHLNIPK